MGWEYPSDKRHGLGFCVHLVADSDQIQIFRKTFRDSANAVRRQSASQSMIGRIGFFIRVPDSRQGVPIQFKANTGRYGADQLRLFALDLQLAVADRHLDPARHLDRFFPYSRHKAPFKDSRFRFRDCRFPQSRISNLESLSADGTEHLSAQSLLLRLLPGKNALRRRQDADSQSAKNRRNFGLVGINPAPWPADPIQR